MSGSADLRRQRLAALHERFAADTPERVRALREACLHAGRRPHDPAAVDALFRLAHDFAGAAGTFGMAEASGWALRLAEACRTPGAFSAGAALRLLEGLESAVAAALRS